MKTASEVMDPPTCKEVCTIVVLYDGKVTRARAMAACDYLVNQFWPEVELKIHWWRTDFLRDAAFARVAADNAIASDFLIFCSETDGGLSPALKFWFESWLERRGERMGVLVDLASGSRSIQREFYLREAGRRGRFDYLKAVPDEGLNSVNTHPTTTEIAGRMNDMPDESRPPSHFGLNE